MSTSRPKTVPATWDDPGDVPFLQITAALFTPGFRSGASVLIASYDDDVRDATRTAAPVTTAVSEPDRV